MADFSKKLKQAIHDLGLKQMQVVGLTGKSKASISQYLSGRQVPPAEVQREIAVSLGLAPDYFSKPAECPPGAGVEPVTTRRAGAIRRLSVKEAATLLGVDKMTVSKGLQQGVFPWGYGIKTTERSWTYIINADSFSRIEGVACEGE